MEVRHRYPLVAATEIAVGAARAYQADPGSLRRIVLCCFGTDVAEIYSRAANQT